MTDAALAKKLQLRPGQGIRVLHTPDGLAFDLPAAGASTAAPAVLVFVTSFAEAEQRVAAAVEAARADDLAWVAYPKAGKLGTDLDRDPLAAFMTARGVRPVRQAAIDDIWSALRFRPPA